MRTLTLLPNPPGADAEAEAEKAEAPAATGFRQKHSLVRRTLVTTAAAALLAVFFAAGTLLPGKGHDSVRSVTVAAAGDWTSPTASAAPALPKPTPQEDANRRMAELTAQIHGLSDSVDALRVRVDTMRAGADTVSASVATLRADLDRNRTTDDVRAIKKSVDALRQGLEQSKVDSAAALNQLAQKLDHAGQDGGQKIAAATSPNHESEDLRALKKSVDALKDGFGQAKADSSAALAQIVQRLDRAEREPTAKVAQLGERLDRLEHRTTVASADVTGSIPAPLAAALPPKPPAIPGFAVRDVTDGAALIESRNGLFEISPGETIPGGGLVQSIERRGREWVVITSRGVISSARP